MLEATLRLSKFENTDYRSNAFALLLFYYCDCMVTTDSPPSYYNLKGKNKFR